MEKNKYKLIADYHTHTIYSRNGHGKGTIRENVEEAINKGLEEIYITDHGPGHIFFGLKRKKLPEIRRTIDTLNEEYSGKIKIFLGVEANVVDYNGKYDIEEEDLKYFDIVNLGYHSGVFLRNFKSIFIYHILNRLGRFSKKIESYCIEKNTDAIVKIIEENNINIITHPGDKVKVDIKRLAKVCKENNTLMEINNHHPHLSVDEIKEAMPSGVNFSLGSDAHRPEKVGLVDKAIKRVEESGLAITRIKNLREVK